MGLGALCNSHGTPKAFPPPQTTKFPELTNAIGVL
jgi:hypothetical protein